MKMSIVIALALAGCSCSKKADREPAPTPSKTGRVLPGTEAMQRLLPSVGRAAAMKPGTATALDDLFGKGGVLGGGDSMGLGLAGASADSKAPASAKPVATGADPTPRVAVKLTPASAGGDCAAVGKRLGELVRAMTEAELQGADPQARDMVAGVIEGSVTMVAQSVEAACAQQAWPRELVDCLLTGADLAALQACERHATPAMRAAANAPQPAVAHPTTPAPTWSGGADDCAAVAAHAAALVAWELTAAPAEAQQTGRDLLATMTSGVEDACTTGGWPEDQRRCVLRASSLDALNACAR
jgi:hypothetical protein